MSDLTGHALTNPSHAATARPVLVGAESLLLMLLTGLAVVTITLPVMLGRVVDWPDFLPGVVASLGLMALGFYARIRVGAMRLALATIGVGLFLGFSALLAVLIFALFPLQNPMIDPWLIGLDAQLGYHWAGFVIGLADYPALGRALALVYNAAVPMVLAVVVLLGALGRTEALHRLLLVGLVSLIIAVTVWWLWPSIGPSAYQTVPDSVATSINLVFSAQAGAMLRDLVAHGPGVIDRETIVGVVAFPSYHTVMACMVVWYARGTWAFPLALMLGVAMLPAILSHGGHNLVDVLAGLALFATLAAAAARYLPDASDTGRH